MTQHARRISPARPTEGRPADEGRTARPVRPDTRRTDLRRLGAAVMSAAVPGAGQLANRRFRLARWLLIPALALAGTAFLLLQLQSPARLAAWAISPAVLQALLLLNAVVLAWRVLAVGHAFFDGRYPAVPGRLGFIGLVVIMIAVLAPHAYAWQVGSAAGAAFARIFEDRAIGGDVAAAPLPRPGERINVLIVGVDKTPRRPATLTDTMIVASLDPVGRSISMVSIPRDMVNVPLGNGNDFGPKINSLYGYAGRNPDEFPQGPMRALQDALGALLGIPIHYHARMDFRGFIAMVDAVGGIDINVKKGIEAPDYGLRWQPDGWSITKGRHHLDGRNALAYARVRKAEGESDFTRAARQQEILVALRDRAMSGGSLLFDLPDLLDAVGDAARTDIPVAALPDLAVTVEEVDRADIVRVVIRKPLVRAERTRYGDSQVPDLAAIREMAAGLFSEPGTPPIAWPSGDPSGEAVP